MKKMQGVITAMTTPFLADGNVDFPALTRHADFLIDAGVHALYPCGTTGEMLLMTIEQREAVAECVVARAAGRVTVFIHTGALRLEDTIRLAGHAAKIGADGIGVVTPSFFGLTQRELVGFYKAVNDSLPAGFPMYLYNIPQCAANDLSAAACAEIAQLSNVVGLKYSYQDMHRTLDYMQAGGAGFSLLVGFDRLLLAALAIGCDGTVSGASTVFPEPFVAGYNAYQRGDFEEARRNMWIANDIVNILRAGSRLSYFKAAQTMRGLPGGHVHAPLLDVTEEERTALRKDLAPYLELYPLG